MVSAALLLSWTLSAMAGSPAAPVARLAAQVRPVPPVPPSPPLPPNPPLPSNRRGLRSDRVEWSHDYGGSLRITVRGRVDLTDDERDVKDIIGNGYVEISEQARSWFFRPDGRRYVVRRVANGELSRRFIVNGSDQPMDAAARSWIGDAIQAFVRDSGFNADLRIARILATRGATGVLEEIARVPSDFVRAIYYVELAKQASADKATIERALRQAAHDIGSDFELARTLGAFADTVTLDDALGTAFADATRSIGSDFEHARVLTALLQSDRQTMVAERVVLASVTGIQSDFERQRVLSTLAVKKGLADETVIGIAQSTSSMGSDFEKARVLLRLVGAQPIGPAAKPALVKAVNSIGSDFERGRVLSTMLRQGTLQ
jgi:hypothetical protein